MIALLLIASVIVIVLFACWPKRDQQEDPKYITSQEWIEAEEHGEVAILDDRGTDNPTVQFRRRR